MNLPLITKYRPKSFDDVVGQAAVLRGLKSVIARKQSQSFLFSGPSGTGKTTCARIALRALNVKDTDIMEIDAGKFTSIDDMRKLSDQLIYRPFSGGNRGVIIDEAHGLSKHAWQSLLKIVEEPPAFLMIAFCTTEPGKVPGTIKTRCTPVQLVTVKNKDMLDFVDDIADREKIKLDDAIADMIVSEAHGSPRQALVNLSVVSGAKTKLEARDALKSALQSDPVLQLCQFLVARGSWPKAMTIFEKLADTNPESVRIVVCNYFAKVAMGAKSDKAALPALGVIEAFGTSYNPSEGSAPLLLSIGRVVFGE